MQREETVQVTVRLTPDIAQKLRKESTRYGLQSIIVQQALEQHFGLGGDQTWQSKN